LYLGDCREILSSLPSIDALVTDPPYGIGGWDAGEKQSMTLGLRKDGSVKLNRKRHSSKTTIHTGKPWDVMPDKSTIETLLKLAREHIIFGGHLFSLPPSNGWLIWEKGVAMPSLSKCEMAWTSCINHTEIFHYLWAGFRKADLTERRHHPTQKPLQVMQWCLNFLSDQSIMVLDPYMGVGTTGIACATRGKRFIGIEKEESYFRIACDRIADAYRQTDLFTQGNMEKTMPLL
jgi:site-specific DNA-methyltransferase (adenine-specific)/modification methylase